MFLLKLFFVALALMSCSGSLSEPWEEVEEDADKEEAVINYVTGSIWPKPQSYKGTGKVYTLTSNNFSFDSVGETSDVLKQALMRYKVLVFPDAVEKPKDGLSQIIKLTVKVLDKYAPPSLESDESCLETFSQVVYQDQMGLYLANGSKIVDHPRFQHRGFMIDTSRHYLHPSIILKFIDALSYSKFNVFHWHVVDDQSFPFVSETFPQLSGQGAYNNKTHVFTKDDVNDIVEYGRMRGIRVVPEFDTPGHTRSWGSIENLLTPCYSEGKPSGASNPNITTWMKKMGYGQNYSLLEQYYEQHLLSIVEGLGKSYIVWQEVVDNDIKVLPDTVVNVWKAGWKKEMEKVTSKGLRTILSACWYLNRIQYRIDWDKYYTCEPTDFTGTEEQKELVIGGTGCMWGEYVDGTNILPRTWPRALAVGERLWSSKDTTDLNDAKMRLWEHRCRYVRRGIPAEPGTRSQYCRYEWRV
ncbi:hypothetical protein pdam_00003199 [Pocillopora damicornis]|uniref:beta-N-acetylhexosaminidase n=1 Tax=Pocillopora damicornis TaxID=46731 RepID=A0A3M6UAV3_POCDA|nr:hypothetical protein pdam_00003199 [Pocillopora damicornis]